LAAQLAGETPVTPPKGTKQSTAPQSTDRSILLNDGRRLGYADLGDPLGVPILVFHGFRDSRLTVHPDTDVLTKLGCRVIAVDRPGTGLSDPKDDRSLVADWARDVAQLAESLRIKEYGLLGWSLGGPYALACTSLPGARAVSIVSSLAPLGLVPPSTLAGCDKGMLEWIRIARGPDGPSELRRTMTASFAPFLEAIQTDPEGVISTGARLADQDVVSDRAIRAALAQGLREAFRQGIGGMALDFALVCKDWGFAVENVEIPTALWYGTDDLIISPAMGTWLLRRMPRAALHLVDRAGHLVFLSRWHDILTDLRMHVEAP
jgi:pimeloyl-ACP methyl ester carboxylesterase